LSSEPPRLARRFSFSSAAEWCFMPNKMKAEQA
jgi:hypothetical protein